MIRLQAPKSISESDPPSTITSRDGYGVKMVGGARENSERYDEGPAYAHPGPSMRWGTLMGWSKVAETLPKEQSAEPRISLLFLHRCEDLVHLCDVLVRQFLELSD